jgi:putative tryptophan/tyrosine transport system substrate-binding protein
MQRRWFLYGSAAAVITASRRARAQQPKKMARIGVLWHAASAEEEAIFLKPLVEGIAQQGYIDGKNVVFEHRFPAEQPERFKALAHELVQLNMDLIIASAPNAAFAAKEATKTIPIIFIAVPDPVETGLVDSLAHPGGNVTGFAYVDVSPKRLEVFKEVFPQLATVVIMVNPANPAAGNRFVDRMRSAAGDLKMAVRTVEVTGPQDFERAFSEVRADEETGVLLPFDSMFFANRTQVAQVALADRLPVMAFNETYVKAGILVSYGPDAVELFRSAGAYVDKILKGMKPADLPVEQPTKYNLAINLKTARAIALAVPESVLARADMLTE